MVSALITGINGFTGAHLAQELMGAGYSVSGIAQYSSAENRFPVLECDLTNRERTIEVISPLTPDVVVHLAGISFAAHDDVEALYTINVLGTRNLLEALAMCHRPPRAVLLISSATIYGDTNLSPLTELVTATPTNDYAVSKLAMEHMARLWQDKLPITIARTFNYTGRGQSLKFLIPKIVDHFKRKASIIELGNIDVIRDFSDVRDIAKIYRRLLETDCNHDTFNVCAGIGHSLINIIHSMKDISGHDMKVVVNPRFVRARDIHQLIGSRQKLNTVIGDMSPTPLHETLRWMYEHDI